MRLRSEPREVGKSQLARVHMHAAELGAAVQRRKDLSRIEQALRVEGAFEALLIVWKDAQAANVWSPKKIDGVEKLRHRRIRIVRDYGRFDRREAPQFYPDVKGGQTLHAEAKRAAAAN